MNENNREITYDEAFLLNYSVMVKSSMSMIGENDAEDVVNETFALLYLKWDSIDNHSEKVITVWLHRALKKKCLEYHRKNSKHHHIVDPEILNSLSSEDIIVASEQEQKFTLYIDVIKEKLSPAEYDVFDCILVKGMNIDKTSSALGLSSNAVRVRWHRTKNHISSFIADILD